MDEKYLTLVLLMAPGFITSFVSQLLGTKPDKKGEVFAVMRYFAYSFFSLIMTYILLMLCGYVWAAQTYSEMINGFNSMGKIATFIIIMFISSIIIGALWSQLGKKYILRGANLINQNLGQNINFIDGTLLDQIVNDGKEHYIILEKHGIKAEGFYYGKSDPSDDNYEISISTYPEYQGLAQKRPRDFQVKQTYIDLKNDIKIIEYTYPEAIFTGNYPFPETVLLAPEGSCGALGGCDGR